MVKKSRNPEKTRAHILEVAFGEIYRKGFQGVSIDAIVNETSVTKGAFFHYFPTKQELGYAIVDEILNDVILERWITPLKAYKNPINGILSRYKKIIETAEDADLPFGCPLNNLIQEMSPVDPIFKEKLRTVISLWIDKNEEYIKKAQELGYLKKDVDTRQLAEFIVMTQEASYGLTKTVGDKTFLWSSYHSLKKYLAALSV